MKLCLGCGKPFDAPGWACPNCGFEPPEREGVRWLAPDAVRDTDGFDPAAFAALVGIEERSFWFRSRNRLVLWALNQYFPRAESLLEIGCGTGYVLAGIREKAPRMALAGAELYPEALPYVSERVPDATLLQLDARVVPFDSHYDVVGAFDVLEHIDDDRAVLAGMKQAAKSGGGVIITVPQHPWLWSADDEYARHRRRYTRTELVTKLEEAGLRTLRVTSFVSLLLPLMAVSRARRRNADEGYDPTQEHARAERMGAAFERILGIELALIRRGVSLPMGGSLLAVARRV